MEDISSSNVPVPYPRSITSKTSSSSYSLKSKLTISSISDKSSLPDSRPITPEESVSIDLSENGKIGSNLEIYIHKTDILKVDTRIRHPSIIIHIVDSSAWEYLKKNDKDGNGQMVNISPLLTSEFNFKTNKTVLPGWNERISVDEPYVNVITEKTTIFFELVDFVGSNRPPLMSNDWYRIAWAFVKPVGSNGTKNTGKPLRLQLYKPGRAPKSVHKNRPMVAHWLKKGTLQKYPSTLYASLNEINRETTAVSDNRLERSSVGSSGSLREILDETLSSSPETFQEYDVKWKRFPGQKCKLPNSEIAKLQPSSEGCMCLKFSHDGLKLAVATSKVINIYTVPEFKLLKQLLGHQGLVYTLRWNKDNCHILSSSSDYTACIWMLKDGDKTDFQILPHPSYVYCAEYSDDVILTGCYDSILRLWIFTHNKWTLCQEMEFHKGFISSVAHRGSMILSADSQGFIVEWTLVDNRLEMKRAILVPEIRNVTISNIQLHPGGKRLLIQTRDSVLRMMDLQTAAIVQWFRGGVNNKVQTGCVLSPCGNLVLACGEDGPVNVWEAYTGKQLAFYTNRQPLTATATSGAVDYHPHDHILAFGVYTPARSSPVYVAQYKKDPDLDIGLRLLAPAQPTECKRGATKSEGQTHHHKITAETTSTSQHNDHQQMRPLMNIIRRMDSVIKTYKTNA
ncbi:jouberin-like [Adelges cooleyi]|uniref:jouberin-like n=1 Tax=Adelges cooleyi TaxID=133065 RepID=UPI0021801C46|nr:jouberin-like [Adelges cooleyi]